MKFFKVQILVLFLIAFVANNCFSQGMKWGLGGELIYNFKPKSLGFGIRGEIPIIEDQLSAVPQISYFPAFSFSQVKDFNAAVAVHYSPFNFAILSPYALAAGGYNKRTFLAGSGRLGETASTWSGELGLGVRMETCWRPFLELRYNFKWKEPTIRLGLMYMFNCKEDKKCPAYRESW